MVQAVPDPGFLEPACLVQGWKSHIITCLSMVGCTRDRRHSQSLPIDIKCTSCLMAAFVGSAPKTWDASLTVSNTMTIGQRASIWFEDGLCSLQCDCQPYGQTTICLVAADSSYFHSQASICEIAVWSAPDMFARSGLDCHSSVLGHSCPMTESGTQKNGI